MDFKALAARFHALFAGMERAYGTYNEIELDQTRTDGKFKGKATTKRQPVTDELWQAHLEGKNGIGIVPIRDDGTCVFGAIDIDQYAAFNHADIAKKLQALAPALIPCRSKSGGCHVYLFTKVPVPAAKMIAVLGDIAASLGFGNMEIFPKQTKAVSESDCASWINMPYFDGEQTVRIAVKPNGDAYSIEEFLEAAEAHKVDASFFEAKLNPDSEAVKKKRSLLPDGPPCLQHLMEAGFPDGSWNTGVFNLGIYCRKAYPVGWQDQLVQLNAKHFPPDKWPVSDVQEIARSLAKKEYQYTCSKHPLVEHCNQVQCRQRKYGVGGGASSFPILGELRVLLTQPEIFFLDVQNKDGDVVVLELTPSQLNSPKEFQKACVAKLFQRPPMPSDAVWGQTVNALLDNVVRIEPLPEDSSAEGQFWEMVERFCTDRAQAHTEAELLAGKPYTEKSRTYFRLQDLLSFLKEKKFGDFNVQQVAKALKMRQDGNQRFAQADKRHIGDKFVNLWSVPEYKRGVDKFALPDELTKDDLAF